MKCPSCGDPRPYWVRCHGDNPIGHTGDDDCPDGQEVCTECFYCLTHKKKHSV